MSGPSVAPPIVVPYKGLEPFTEEDADYFFGRDRDREIIRANLLGSRLTLLYGASGVGKSSILNAGVIHHLRRVLEENRLLYKAPKLAIVLFKSWRDDPLSGLLQAVRIAVAQALDIDGLKESSPSAELAEALRHWTLRLGGNIFIIFDQFEDYFLYHGSEGSPEFTREFSRAVDELDLRVNFLISIREDALARLDHFKGIIPGLFNNYLRLEHLDREAARLAVCGPLEKFHAMGGEGPFKINSNFVDELLDEVVVDRLTVGDVGGGFPGKGGSLREKRIEAPYLQLVVRRLWLREREVGSEELRPKTLEVLGGAEAIVRNHIDLTFKELSYAEQDIAARVLFHLITPQGTKLSLSAKDLTEYTKRAEEELKPVLEKLADSAVRILRPVTAGRYEIFHDVLGPAILDWRRRFVQVQQKAEKLTQDRWRMAVWGARVLVLVVLVIGVPFLVVQNIRQRDELLSKSDIIKSDYLTIQSLHVEPDIALLLAVEALRVKDTAESRRNLVTYALGNPPTMTSAVKALEFTTDRNLVAEAEDGQTCSWSVRNFPKRSRECENKFDIRSLEDKRVETMESVLLDPRRCRKGELAEWSVDLEFLACSDGDGVIKLQSRRGASVTLSCPQEAVNLLKFSSDGKLITSWDGKKRFCSWDTESGILKSKIEVRGSVASLRGHDPVVPFFEVSSDGNWLAYLDEGGWLWRDTGNGTQKMEPVKAPGRAQAIAVSRDGELATGGEDGTVRLLIRKSRPDKTDLVSFETERRNLSNQNAEDLLAEACRRANRNLSKKDWEKFFGMKRPYECTCSHLPPGDGIERPYPKCDEVGGPSDL